MVAQDIDRKVRQLDNDVQAIYGLLGGITKTQDKHSTALADLTAAVTGVAATQQRQYNRISELDARAEGLETGMADVKATLTRHGNRLDAIDTRLDGVDTRLDGIDTRLDGVDTRLDGIDTRLDGIDTRLDGIDSKLDRVLDRLSPDGGKA